MVNIMVKTGMLIVVATTQFIANAVLIIIGRISHMQEDCGITIRHDNIPIDTYWELPSSVSQWKL